MGAYVWRGRKNQTAPPALNGQFTFPSLASLVQGNFSQYTEGSNTPQVQARFTQAEFYVQDDWTVARNLTLNMGLRWQYMQPIYSWANNASGFNPGYYDSSKAATISPTSGLITSAPSPYNGIVLPGSGFPSKAASVVPASVLNNPQVQALFHNLPLGLVNTKFDTFAPRVGFAWDISGKQETVLRGGYGMSYERVEGNYYYNAVSQVPFTAVANLSTAGNADSLGSVGTSAAPQNITNTPDPNLAPPRIHNYSIGIQHRFTSNMVFELNYVGSHAGNLTYRKNLNQAAAGTEQVNPGVARNALRPYKGYGEIYQYTNGATANYNSLQSRLQMNFQQGGIINFSYTWSKALTEGSTFDYQPQNSFNLGADYGPANYSQPQIFVASYVYPLPFWLHDTGWYKRVLSGWQVSGVTRISSGLPINVTQPTGISTAGNLVTTSNVAQRMNIVGSPYAHGGKQYLAATAFATPAAGTYGNLGYDAIKGPLFNNWDAALQKNIPIHESIGLEFRAEMFNVPNHLSLFTIAAVSGSSNFGQATAATDPRTMEFVLRVHF
ncbi:MAG: TonB-dependent receptor [Edaphobacter sp.]|uniref:TonB-dependent receptor domain-containing protein n=1 Tax=Edaphobacter sp. TaxID=1934404 RepID=UPI00239BF39A|nr:TonB-dependent receptor [Edaphobacter sp.]MDE1177310.1 TonB-dependent receptor [Edaphobacter sp.]